MKLHLVYILNFTPDTGSRSELARKLDPNVAEMETLAMDILNAIAGGARENTWSGIDIAVFIIIWYNYSHTASTLFSSLSRDLPMWRSSGLLFAAGRN